MPTWNLRPAEVSDLPEIRRIYNRSLDVDWHCSPSKLLVAWTEQFAATYLGTHTASTILERDGVVIGFCGIKRITTDGPETCIGDLCMRDVDALTLESTEELVSRLFGMTMRYLQKDLGIERIETQLPESVRECRTLFLRGPTILGEITGNPGLDAPGGVPVDPEVPAYRKIEANIADLGQWYEAQGW